VAVAVDLAAAVVVAVVVVVEVVEAVLAAADPAVGDAASALGLGPWALVSRVCAKA
jgi:ABC-type sulfate transport system permease component